MNKTGVIEIPTDITVGELKEMLSKMEGVDNFKIRTEVNNTCIHYPYYPFNYSNTSYPSFQDVKTEITCNTNN